jgi:hypothetical protein
MLANGFFFQPLFFQAGFLSCEGRLRLWVMLTMASVNAKIGVLEKGENSNIRQGNRGS